MTVEEISFRDFTRGHIPSDVLLLKDKKTNKQKGLFVSKKYADEVLEYLKKRDKKKKQEKINFLLDFVGEFGSLDDDLIDAKSAKIKAQKYE